MEIKNSTERYGAVAQLLHWSVVALIVTQFVLAKMAEHAPKLMEKAVLLTRHKSFGMTVLMLAVLRLVWRLANTTPRPVPNLQPWQDRAASVMHWTLYAFILVTPLVGWLMSSARNFSVSYFGLFTFPNLVSPDTDLFEQLKQLHAVLAYTMATLAVLHILAALKHHFFDRDNTLRRMLPMKLK